MYSQTLCICVCMIKVSVYSSEYTANTAMFLLIKCSAFTDFEERQLFHFRAGELKARPQGTVFNPVFWPPRWTSSTWAPTCLGESHFLPGSSEPSWFAVLKVLVFTPMLWKVKLIYRIHLKVCVFALQHSILVVVETRSQLVLSFEVLVSFPLCPRARRKSEQMCCANGNCENAAAT